MINKFFQAAKMRAFKNIPASVNPENAYAKSFAAVLILAISADNKFEMEEFKQASIFMEKDETLRNADMTTRAVEFLRSYASAVKEVMAEDNISFPSMQTELIADIRNCPDEYKRTLRGVIDVLKTISDGDELAVLNRINL